MKKLLLLVSIVSFTLMSSCSKTETPTDNNNNNGGGGGTPTTNYFFKCKVNGVEQQFKAFTLAKDDTINPNYIILVAYANQNSTQPPYFTITMAGKSPGWVKGLTYTMNENDQTSTAEFKDEGNFLYKSLNTPGNGGLNITFTEFDVNKGGKVGGVFNGSLQLEENNNTVVITDGTFLVPMFN